MSISKSDPLFPVGTLSIIAEAEINRTKINGKYKGNTGVPRIQGQTLEQDEKFKENICKYLEAPIGVSNYQSILNELGHNKAFRIMTYQETRYHHFYPSIYGIPKGSIYPTENTGGDGGFGIMQLTIPKPTYLQIWNWKENINAGVRLIDEKVRIAKSSLKKQSGGQLPSTDTEGKSILRMEAYHQYGPSYYDEDGEKIPYWKWDRWKGWIFSTDDWLHADILRDIEDAVDAGDFSITTMRSWKYNGEP